MYKKFEVGETFKNANGNDYVVIKSKEWYSNFESTEINRHLLLDMTYKYFVIAYNVYSHNGIFSWQSGSYPGRSIDDALEEYNQRCEGDN